VRAAALWVLVVVTRTVAARHPDWTESVYARRIYPVVARAM